MAGRVLCIHRVCRRLTELRKSRNVFEHTGTSTACEYAASCEIPLTGKTPQCKNWFRTGLTSSTSASSTSCSSNLQNVTRMA